MWKGFRNAFGRPELHLKSSDERDERVENSRAALVQAAETTFSLAQDITETLKDRVDDYKSQINATEIVVYDPLIMVDSDGFIEAFNSAAEATFGYKARHVVGKNISILFQSDKVKEPSFQDILFAFTSNSTFSNYMDKVTSMKGRRKNGEIFFTTVSMSKFLKTDKSLNYMFLIQDITDDIESDRKYAELVERQQSILTAMPDIVMTIDDEDRFTTLSFPADCMLKPIYENFIGKSIDEVEGNAIPKSFLENVRACRYSSGVNTWTFDILNNTDLVNLEARGTRCNNEVLVLIRDITSITATQLALKESEAQFRAFGEASEEAMMIHNADSILQWNERLTEITGYSSDELKRMAPLDFYHPYERKSAKGKITSETSDIYETLFMSKEGSVIEVMINTSPILWKNTEAKIDVIRDLTNMKDYAKILELGRERYRTLADNSIDILFCFDANYRITFANTTFCQFVGISSFDELEDLVLQDLIHEEDLDIFSQEVTNVLKNNTISRMLMRVKHETGFRHLDCILKGIFDDENNFLEFHCVSRDVSFYIS